MQVMGRFLLCACAVFLMPAADETSPVGDWKTIDDKTGQPKAIVRIYEQGGELFARVESILDPTRATRRCDKCTDDRKGQPIAGMVIVRHLKRKGNEYSGGDILDPDNGSVYRCRMKVFENGGKLSVRGYLGFSLLGRSQIWIREAATATPRT
jgi:uncharacterized protein (DUF2147 family)